MSNEPNVSIKKSLRDWLENICIARNQTTHHDCSWNIIDPKETPIELKPYPTGVNGRDHKWNHFRRSESRGLT